MALEDLTPAVRVEAILDGADIEPANRLEYFLKQAANEVPKAAAENTGKVLTSTLDAEDNPVISWEAAGGLPAYDTTDEGKVLTVEVADGVASAGWANVPSSGGVPILYSANAGLNSAKVLTSQDFITAARADYVKLGSNANAVNTIAARLRVWGSVSGQPRQISVSSTTINFPLSNVIAADVSGTLTPLRINRALSINLSNTNQVELTAANYHNLTTGASVTASDVTIDEGSGTANNERIDVIYTPVE